MGAAREVRSIHLRAISGEWPVRSMLFAGCFASGASALILELVWSRLLFAIFGSGLMSYATVLTVFMGGLAIGAWIIGNLSDRLPDPLKIYGLIELAIAASAIFLAGLFHFSVFQGIWQFLNQSIGEAQPGQIILRFALSSALLLVPTGLMGATFPLLCRIVSVSWGKGPKNIGYVYAFNTLGAFAGVILTGFALIPTFGLAASQACAAGLNFLVFMLAQAIRKYFLVFRGNEIDQVASEPLQTCEQPSEGRPGLNNAVSRPAVVLISIVVALSGALSMVLEVIWTRIFSLIMGSTTYALCLVLAFVLLGLSIGAWLASRLASNGGRAFLILAFVPVLAGAYVLLTLEHFNDLPWALICLARNLHQAPGLSHFVSALVARACAIAFIVLPVAILSGMSFPLVVRILIDGDDSLAEKASKLYALNSIGSILGSWTAGFVLIPLLGQMFVSGIQASFVLVAFCELLVGFMAFIACVISSDNKVQKRRFSFSGVIVFFLIGFLFVMHKDSHWDLALISSGASLFAACEFEGLTQDEFLKAVGAQVGDNPASSKIVYYREGQNSTVTVGTNVKGNVVYLKNDGKVEASVPSDISKPCPTCDMPTQVLLGLLPLIIHPSKAERALVIGYGSGTTTGATLNVSEMKKVIVAEIERAVLEADPYFRQANNRPLSAKWKSTGRVETLILDGRNYLSACRSNFDVIICQPGDPWVNGMSNLYTHEFWSAAKSKLASNGLFCQWLPLYAVTPEYLAVLLRTFSHVFPSVLVYHPQGAAELILIGADSELAIDVEKLRVQFAKPLIRKSLLEANIHTPEELLAGVTGQTSEVKQIVDKLTKTSGNGHLNTDDNLLCEFGLLRKLFEYPDNIIDNEKIIAEPRFSILRVLKNYGAAHKEKAEFLSRLASAYLNREQGNPLNAACNQQATYLADEAVNLARTPFTLNTQARIRLTLNDVSK